MGDVLKGMIPGVRLMGQHLTGFQSNKWDS